MIVNERWTIEASFADALADGLSQQCWSVTVVDGALEHPEGGLCNCLQNIRLALLKTYNGSPHYYVALLVEKHLWIGASQFFYQTLYIFQVGFSQAAMKIQPLVNHKLRYHELSLSTTFEPNRQALPSITSSYLLNHALTIIPIYEQNMTNIINHHQPALNY